MMMMMRMVAVVVVVVVVMTIVRMVVQQCNHNNASSCCSAINTGSLVDYGVPLLSACAEPRHTDKTNLLPLRDRGANSIWPACHLADSPTPCQGSGGCFRRPGQTTVVICACLGSRMRSFDPWDATAYHGSHASAGALIGRRLCGHCEEGRPRSKTLGGWVRGRYPCWSASIAYKSRDMSAQTAMFWSCPLSRLLVSFACWTAAASLALLTMSHI